MNMENFIKEVALMRDLQKRYFQARKKSSPGLNTILKECKVQERKVDELLSQAAAPTNQMELFNS